MSPKLDRPPLSWRYATEADLRFVRASWFESYRKGGHAPDVAFPTYREGMGRIIERCLQAGATLVAFLPEVPDEVIGWACFTSTALHYVYVKQAYRRLGVAREILGEHPQQWHTHDTRAGRHLAAALGTKFNPYLLSQ